MPWQRLLVNQGANLTSETTQPLWTSLHRACSAGHLIAVEVLLNEHPALINHATEEGLTPLMAACRYGHSTILSTLIQRRANLHQIDNQGRTALFLAAEHGMSASIKVLTTDKDGRDNSIINKKLKRNLGSRGEENLSPVMMAASTRARSEPTSATAASGVDASLCSS